MTLRFKEKKVSSTRLKSHLDLSCRDMIYKGDDFWNYHFYKLVRRLRKHKNTSNIFTCIYFNSNVMAFAKKYSDLIFIDIFSNCDIKNINKFIDICEFVD